MPAATWRLFPFGASSRVTVFRSPSAMMRSSLKTSLPVPRLLLWLRSSTMSTTVQSTSPDAFSLVTAQPLNKPVYISLTKPLKRKTADPSSEDNIVALDPTVFDHPIRRDILHLCVTHYLDSLRQGTASTKTRGEVRGSGIKLRPQKGSGRARLGDGQSPMLVGGGVAFGPKPRDFSTKLPRKVIQMGMRVAFSAKVRERQLGVMTSLSWPNGKTKHLSQIINARGLQKTLFITGEDTPCTGLERAIANIPRAKLVTAEELNVYEILKWHRVLLDMKAVEYFEQLLGKQTPV